MSKTNLEVYQMDMKTIFLTRDLDKENDMEQFEGFFHSSTIKRKFVDR